MFGQQIAAAFAHRRQKWKGSTSGARLTDPVRRITRVWIEQTGRCLSAGSPSPEAKQALQSASSADASEAAAPPPKLRKTDIFRLYGLEMKALPAQSGCTEIISSQEVLTQSPTRSPPRPEKRTSSSSVDCLDMNRLVMVRMSSGGMQEESPLVASPSGFATASFGGSEVETEVPNLLVKAPHLPVVFRRPAGASEVTTDAHNAGEESGEEAGKGPEPSEGFPREGEARKYSKMFYNNTECFGVRQCFGPKRQIACVSGKRLGLGKDALEKVTDEAILKLESGEVTEGAIKQWIREALSEVSS